MAVGRGPQLGADFETRERWIWGWGAREGPLGGLSSLTQGPGPDCRARAAQPRQTEAPQLRTLLLREPRRGQSLLPPVANRAHALAWPEEEMPPDWGRLPGPAEMRPPALTHPHPPLTSQPSSPTCSQTSRSRGAGLRPGLGALVSTGGCPERRRPSKWASPAGWGDTGPRGALPRPGPSPQPQGQPATPGPVLPHPRVPGHSPPPVCPPLSPSSSKLPKGNHHATLAQHTI